MCWKAALGGIQDFKSSWRGNKPRCQCMNFHQHSWLLIVFPDFQYRKGCTYKARVSNVFMAWNGQTTIPRSWAELVLLRHRGSRRFADQGSLCSHPGGSHWHSSFDRSSAPPCAILEDGRNPTDSAVESNCGPQLDGTYALCRHDKYMTNNYWLVVWNIFIFQYIQNNHPNWPIFFRGVETTNQTSIWQIISSTSSFLIYQAFR